MKHNHIFYKKFKLQKRGSKTENIQAKDPIWIRILLKIMKMEPKRLQDVNGAKFFVFVLSVLKMRD